MPAKQPFSAKEILKNTEGNAVSLEQAKNSGSILIDVRSAEEFERGAIDGAINIPLFDGYEKSIIGTLYKHAGHQEAIDKGFEFAERKFPDLIENFRPFLDKSLAIYCAKGGMRSRSIVNLLTGLGVRASQLEGGYHQYRRDTLDFIENFDAKLIVLHGLTGTGKTRIIERLDHAIDLEAMARHRSSLFGGINMQPRNQRQFEAALVTHLASLDQPPFFIEGESNKIGRVFLPQSLAKAMKNGVMIKITAPLATRVKRIVEDYPITSKQVRIQMHNTLLTLQKWLGKDKVETLCGHLRHNRLEELAEILLTDYYDKRYGNMYKRYVFTREISSENLDEAAAELAEFRRQLV
ncbi:MAG: tRNA 2-selenouridine(34) synthase MnmH [Deltaproteobacteria bacterium]|nr:MAG: tRNA 2-selenouridine(34) synthase MnmH [Deltaproteobacteria bacterium]